MLSEYKYPEGINPVGIKKLIHLVKKQAVNSALMYARVVFVRADTHVD